MLRKITVAFFLLTIRVSICLAQDNVARMDEVVRSYVNAKQFMGSVLVARDGKVILSKGYGSANLEWGVPNSPSAKFRLGSITKQFTAACILLLEERGKLKVEDPVKKYMPDAPAAWDKITIFNLLTHTSGIPSFTGFPDYHSMEAIPATPEQLVARFRDKPLEFQPGEKWNYSNSGYVLLGYLIEKISQQSYSQFVQENIFNPLGMKDSGYDSNTAIIVHRASGYSPGAKGIDQCRLYRHEHPVVGRGALLDHGRLAALGTGPDGRQAAVRGIPPENDHAIQERLRVRACGTYGEWP